MGILGAKLLRAAFCVALLCAGPALAGSASPWGKNYFPNVPLIAHTGERVRFFDDLIEGKIVVINFIYTRCVDACPLETAQLTKVQGILGERLGKDIFFYSISIDPEHDTPEVLKEYAGKFKARWKFLTGEQSDIVLLRKKLGLYIEEIQDGSNNHNVSMIIGNQATGQWVKRSPFENPYVLAEQLSHWLTGGKAPPRGADYAKAPQLRNISRGEQLFRTRCLVCHSIGGNEAQDTIGPDLLGVTRKRDPQWLVDWLRAPDRMLAEQDPIAVALFEQYDEVAMPNLGLSQIDIIALIRYMEEESIRLQAAEGVSGDGDIVAVANAWVRQAHPGARATAGYMTLVNIGAEQLTLAKIASPLFENIEIHETVIIDDLPKMRETAPLALEPGDQIRLAPGGKHLMLMGPRRPLAKGQRIELKLIFDSGKEQTVSVAVRE